MRMLLVVPSLLGRGTERVVSWLANELVAHGHDVVLTLRSAAATDFYEVDEAVQVVRHVPARTQSVLPVWSPPETRGRLSAAHLVGVAADRLAYGAFLRRTAARSQADVVVSFLADSNVYAIVSLLGTGVPVVVSERTAPGFHTLGRSARARRLTYPRAAALVVQSEHAAEQAARMWGVRGAVAIGNAAAIASNRPVLPVGERPLQVVHVGALQPEKDHATLISAWRGSQGPVLGWQLVLVGDGPLRGALERQISALGLVGSVRLTGQLADPAAEFAAARVVVLSSVTEGFPNALVEGMSLGCAAISTRSGAGVVELLREGEAGILADVGDPTGLSAALDSVICDDARLRELAVRARGRAADFTPEAVYGQWEELLRSAVRSGSSPRGRSGSRIRSSS